MFARRALEAFFRRWPFYFALLAACLVLGTLNTIEANRSYTSTGSMFIQARSLVAAQSGVERDSFLNRKTPAGFRAREFESLVETDLFMSRVALRVGVELAEDQLTRDFQLFDLRWPLAAEPTSNNLVDFHATTDDPEWSQYLLQGAIDEYIDFHITEFIAQSLSSEDFFNEAEQIAAEDLLASRQRIDEALTGERSIEDLSPDLQATIVQLQEAEVEAQARFLAASNGAEGSRLVRQRAETQVLQQYVLVGRPQLPAERDSASLATFLRLLAFFVIGLVLVCLGPVISAFRIRTVQFREDIEDELDLPVLSIMPWTSGTKTAPPTGEVRTAIQSESAKHLALVGPAGADDPDREVGGVDGETR